MQLTIGLAGLAGAARLSKAFRLCLCCVCVCAEIRCNSRPKDHTPRTVAMPASAAGGTRGRHRHQHQHQHQPVVVRTRVADPGLRGGR